MSPHRVRFIALCCLLTSIAFAAAPPRDTDRHGDPLPSGALAHYGSVRYRVAADHVTFGMSADGKRVFLRAATNGELSILDTATGRINAVPMPTWGWMSCVASPTSDRAIIHGKGLSLSLIDLASGKSIWKSDSKADIAAVAFDPTGEHIACVQEADDDSVVTVHRADTGKQTAAITVKGRNRRVALGPGGSRLLSWEVKSAEPSSPDSEPAEIEAILWDTATGKQAAKLSLPPGSLVAAFRPEGKELAISSGATVRVCNATDGATIRTLRAAGSVERLAYSPDGKHLAAVGGRRAELWQTKTWRRSPTRPGPVGETAALAFPEGRLVIACAHLREVRLWDAATGEVTGLPAGHRGAVTSVRFDGSQLVTAGGDDRVTTWSLAGQARRSETASVVNEADAVHGASLRLCPTGRWGVSWGRGIYVYDRHERRVCLDDLSELAAGSHLVRVARDAPVLVAVKYFVNDTKRGSVFTALRLDDGEQLWTVRLEAQMASALAVSGDGRTVAALVSDEMQAQLRLYDGLSGKLLAETTFLKYEWPGELLEFSPDGRLIAVSHVTSGLSLFDLGGRRGHSIKTESPVVAAVFCPRGRSLALAMGNENDVANGTRHALKVVELSSGGERLSFEPGDLVASLAFSPDGKYLASGHDDGTALLWDLAARGDAGEGAVWARLAGEDAADAYRAMRELRAEPAKAVALVRKHVKPSTPGPGVDEIKKLIASLDDEESPTRDAAQRELGKQGREVEAALRAALAAGPSPEQSRRLKRLLDALPAFYAPEVVPSLRAVELLEMLADDDAKKALGELAKGRAGALLTREAQAALDRVAK